MCKSKKQGGQRCFAHAGVAYAAACEAAGVDPFTAPRDVPEEHQARYAKALVDLATTPKGSMNLRGIIGTWPVGHPARRQLETAFRKGVRLRQEREDAYQQWRQAQGLSTRQRDLLDENEWQVSPTARRCPTCQQFVSRAGGHQCPPRRLIAPSRAPSWQPTTVPEQGLPTTDGMSLPLFEELHYVSCAEVTDLLENQAIATGDDRLLNEYRDAFDYGDPDPDSTDPLPRAAQRVVLEAMEERVNGAIDNAHVTGYIDLEETGNMQALVKRETVQHLATEMSALDPRMHPADADAAANRAVCDWAMNYSHTDHGAKALDKYQAAANILADGGNPIGTTRVDTEEYNAALAVVAQYRLTQNWLKERGITHVTVHRGMTFFDGGIGYDEYYDGFPETPTPGRSQQFRWVPGWIPAEEVESANGPVIIEDTADKPMASYSDSRSVAEAFATHPERELGYVVSTVVPAERVLSMPRTGMGCLGEREVVVLRGAGVWEVTPW